MRKNSIKNTRINGEVLKELSNIIRGEIKDPRIHPMTSVVAVEVAPDLKSCKAYISVLGDEAAQKDTLAGLKSAEGYIRTKLAHTVNLRNTPQIRFITGCGVFHFYSYRIAVLGHIIYLLSSIDNGRISIRLSFIVVAAPISDKRPWVNVLNPQPFCV